MNKKRLIKNIIMIVLIILFAGGIIFTGKYAKDNIKSTSNNTMMQNMGGTPPDMNNNSNNSNSTNSDDTTNTTNNNQNGSAPSGTPPEKPNDSSNSNAPSGNPPEMNNSDSSNGTIPSGTPPEKPEDSNSTDNNQNNDSNSNNQAPSNMPSMNNNTATTLTIPYYIVYGLLSLGISTIILYLIMSRFNKKSFKETLSSSDKAVIYILGTIILTGITTFGTTYFTNNNILKNSSNTTTVNNNTNYKSALEITKDTTITEGSYKSENSDENVISASNDIDVALSNITVTKKGDSDGGDSTSFYGTNSAILAKSGANLTIENATIKTNANGANGVFSYGGSATTNNSSTDGTTINIKNSKITTTGNNAGGIMTTGGGVMRATNLTINTSGISSAAIRSDRGGGKVTVNKGTYKTTGQGSPAIYSTADIKVSNAKLEATASEGVVIEGMNSVELDNCTLTDTNNKLNGQSTTYKNIFLYQSMSGDAKEGNSTFKATNSKITTNKGDSFYVTNTTATIELENNTIKNNDSTSNFLRVQADSWGNSGSNGGIVTLKLTNQKVSGNIVIDSISTLDMTMKDKSTFTGSINSENSAKSIKLTLSKNSKIKLTKDSYVTSLDDEDTTYSNIDFNGYKLYVNGTAIN